MKFQLLFVALFLSMASATQKENMIQNVLSKVYKRFAHHGVDPDNADEADGVDHDVDALVISEGEDISEKIAQFIKFGKKTIVQANGTPNNVQLDYDDNLYLDLSGFFSSSEDLPITFSATGLPDGVSISSNGTMMGVADVPGQYLVFIRGDDGVSSGKMTPFWISVANEDGSIPSYVPMASVSPTVTTTPSSSPSESLPVPSPTPADYDPPVVISAVPNFVSAIDDYVTIDTSDCFLKQDRPITFDIVGLPDGVRFDKASGIIQGKPEVLGKWEVAVTASDGTHLVKLPKFNFIVSDSNGNWADYSSRTEKM